jgi:hypothetical protein
MWFMSSFCVLCPMLPVYIVFGHVPNVALVSFYVLCPVLFLSIFLFVCAQCYPCIFFFVFCTMLSVSFFSIHRKIDTSNIGHKIQKDRQVEHLTQDTERLKRATLGTIHRKIKTGSIGHKTQKDRHGLNGAQITEM